MLHLFSFGDYYQRCFWAECLKVIECVNINTIIFIWNTIPNAVILEMR